jgi:hypothetical protein
MRAILCRFLFVWAALLALISPVLAQRDRFAAEVVSSVPPVASLVSNQAVPELHVRWVAAVSANGEPVPAAAMTPVNSFEVVGRSDIRGPFQRERDPQLAEHELVIVATDANGRETSWQKQRDPRLLRAELPGPTGELSGELLYRPEVELLVVVPDSATMALHVYETYSDGGQFLLRSLGLIQVTLR